MRAVHLHLFGRIFQSWAAPSISFHPHAHLARSAEDQRREEQRAPHDRVRVRPEGRDQRFDFRPLLDRGVVLRRPRRQRPGKAA